MSLRPGTGPTRPATAKEQWRLQALIEHSSEGIVLMDARGVLRFVSPSTARLTGCVPAELAARTILDMVHPEDRPRLEAMLADVVRRPAEAVTVEFRIKHNDESWRWTEATATNLLSDPVIEGIIVNLRETTVYRLLEETRLYAKQLDRLVALSVDLNRPLALQQALAVIGQTTLDLSGANRAAVFLRQPDGKIACAWRRGLSDAYVTELFAHQHELPGPAMMNAPPQDLVRLPGGHLFESTHPVLVPDLGTLSPDAILRRLAKVGEYRALGLWPLTYERRVIGVLACYYDTPREWSRSEQDILNAFCLQAAAAIQNARLYDAQASKTAEIEALYALSRRLRTALTPEEIYSIVCEPVVSFLHADYVAINLLDQTREMLMCVCAAGPAAGESPGEMFPVAGSRSGRVIQAGAPLVGEEFGKGRFSHLTRTGVEGFGPYAFVPLRFEEEIVGTVLMARRRAPAGAPFSPEEIRLMEGIAEIGAAAIRRAQLYQDLRGQVETLKAVYEASKDFAESLDLQQLAEDAVRLCVNALGVQVAWLGRAGPDGAVRMLAHYPSTMEFVRQIVPRWDNSPGAVGATARALRSGGPVVTQDITRSPHRPPWEAAVLAQGLRSVGGFPLISRKRTFGVLGLYSSRVGFFTPERVQFFQSYAHQLAAALENARLFAEAGRRLEHLQALRSIDTAITSHLDLRLTLNILLERAATQLGVDAADVLTLDPHSQTLTFAAGHGFRTSSLRHTRLRLGEGHAGRAALDQRLVAVRDFREVPGGFVRSPLVASEGFVAYYAVPLIARGLIKGVLEVYRRSPLVPDQEWLDFLEALAGQAAIAIEHATVLDDLQSANIELMLAYDRAIEGWSRALDLRDKETEGHTLRVTELTLRLAREMGVPEAELVHLRRGALLHDIGKMGIPDKILLKPGPLTDDEWVIMRRHPEYAYEVLSPVAYLRPALDIPYCHHEKWDGTGYPRGLKGEEIPLAARIFAVVDVWDALCSDRPYRPARTKERARTHIREQSGKHFDPAVVEAFLKWENE